MLKRCNLVVAALTAVLLLAATAAPASAATVAGPFGNLLVGSANGGNGQLNHDTLADITIGKIALQLMPCLPDSGATYTNQVLRFTENAPSGSPPEVPNPILATGKVVNTGTALFDASSSSVTEKSTVQNVRALNRAAGPVISVDNVSATAKTTDAGIVTNKGSTTITDLKIQGRSIAAAHPAPNTRINLNNGLGYVVLNEQSVNPTTGFTVSAIHLHVNNLAGYSGDIYVAQAVTKIVRSPARLFASAWELSAESTAGSAQASVGPQNFIALPCGGTNGIERRQPGVGLFRSGFADLSNLLSIVNGNREPVGSAFTYAIAEVENVNLFDGRVTADAIRSQSNTQQGVGSVHSDGSGTVFRDLAIDSDGDGTRERRIAGTPAPNTTIPLAGIGEIVLNRQQCKADGGLPRLRSTCGGVHMTRFSVTGILVKVTVPHNALFAAGSRIWISKASSGLSG